MIELMTCLAHYLLFDDQDAFVYIKKQYQRMVYDIASGYNVTNDPAVDFEDLKQEGWIGFLEGLSTYDPDRGVALTTHLYIRVAGAIAHLLERTDDTGMRYSRHWDAMRVNIVRSDLYQTIGQEPTAEEIAEYSGLPMLHVIEVLDGGKASLDEPLLNGENGAYDLHDVIPDPDDAFIAADLSLAVSDLTARQREVVEKHVYGGLTFEEIGPTKQAAQQTYERAIDALRASVENE